MTIRNSFLVYLGALCALLLVAKFAFPLLVYEVPMGYDPGLYRFLFLQYADALSHWHLPILDAWAKEHPPGLFLLGSVFIHLGFSVDMLLGWVWNSIPVVLAVELAYVTAKRTTLEVGVLVILTALLSHAYFDGFYAMYYKVYVALLFLIPAFYFAEKLSPWLIVYSLLTVMIHHQTGLILTLSIGAWWVMKFPSLHSNKRYMYLSIGLCIAAILGVLWYVPHWQQSFWIPLKSILLLRGEHAPAGSFPEAIYYIRITGILLALGIVGWISTLKTQGATPWHFAAFWCAIFIVFRLVFYRRFYLHLDFFLLPFAAIALQKMFTFAQNNIWNIILLVSVIVLQFSLSGMAMLTRVPQVSSSFLSSLEEVQSYIPNTATVIALDNVSGMWIRGWLPEHSVGGPGLFDVPGWTYDEWNTFIYGNEDDRKVLLQTLKDPVYFFVTPLFQEFYGDDADRVMQDPCLVQLENYPLLYSRCSHDV